MARVIEQQPIQLKPGKDREGTLEGEHPPAFTLPSYYHGPRGLLRRLLQNSLVKRDPSNGQDQHRRSCAKDLHEWSKFLHPVHDFHLFPRHVGFRFTEEELVILLHCESAAINQQSDQGSCEHSPCDQKLEQSRHRHLVTGELFWPPSRAVDLGFNLTG